MGKVNILSMMKSFIQDTGKIIYKMAKANKRIKMVIDMKVNGKII